MLDGIAIMERVHERGASIKALDRQFLDLSTTIGKGILAFLSALAQDERERILKRSQGRPQTCQGARRRFFAPIELRKYAIIRCSRRTQTQLRFDQDRSSGRPGGMFRYPFEHLDKYNPHRDRCGC
jgi:hypothetical protein